MHIKHCLRAIVLGLSVLTVSSQAVETAAPAGHVDVLFSPGGGCEERLVSELAKAKKTLRLQAYTFTSAKVAKALADAKKRGVDCEVVLDKSNRTDKFTAAVAVHDAGIPCWIDDLHTVANNKVILIDDTTLLTGSYNFTRAAEASNAENLLIITGMPDLMKAYAENYAKHREHAKPYTGPEDVPDPDAAGAGAAGSTAAANPGKRVKLVSASQPSGNKSGKVWVTANGKKYHAAGCEFLHGAGREIDRSEIQGKYTPCSKCHP